MKPTNFISDCTNLFVGWQPSNYSFNGKEKDDEWSGDGNTYDFDARMYDCRLARFISIDPAYSNTPWYSSYLYGGNSPVQNIDLEGLREKSATDPPKKNIMIIIPTPNEVKEGTYDNIGQNQGTWHIIVANDMTDAYAKTKSYMGATKPNNIYLATHGSNDPGLIMLNNKDTYKDKDGNIHAFVTDYKAFDRYAVDQKGSNATQIKALVKLTGLVAKDGNFVFGACNLAAGKAGETMAASIKKVVTNDINVIVAGGYVTDKYNQSSRKLDKYPIPLIVPTSVQMDRNLLEKGSFYEVGKSGKLKDIGNIKLHDKGPDAVEKTGEKTNQIKKLNNGNN